MIDVPIAVRDALKDGGYKKNYRFIVGRLQQDNVFQKVTDITVGTTITVAANGYYRIYSDTDAAFKCSINGGALVVVPSMAVDMAGGFYTAIGNLSIGDTIIVTESYYTLEWQIETDTTQEVFYPELTIENDKLVKESVKIDERMCSDDNLKFGLCEGSQLEFQAFDIDNLTGKRIQAFVDVKYPVYSYDYDESTDKTTKYETIEECSIPMGWYDVQESSRQASTGIRKISAYNKLKSDYLDAEANALIVKEFGTQTIRILDILEFLLRKYGIKRIDAKRIKQTSTYPVDRATSKKYFTPFKYSDFMGIIGAFTPLAFYKNYTYTCANKNMYIEGVAFLYRYQIKKLTDASTPIQIKVDNSVEIEDTAIATYIQNNLASLESHCDRTAASMWSDIQHMKRVDSSDWLPLEKYFFYVKVVFRDGTYRFYGNQILNADGTFAQLGRTTFTNVDYIDIVVPDYLRYGFEFEGNYLKASVSDSSAQEYAGITNDVPLWGTQQDTYHVPPTMPDGTQIYGTVDKFTVQILTGGFSPAELIEVKPDEMANVTLRALQTAVFETQCQFGRLDRVDNYFIGAELNNGRLYPADTLYPDDELYPLSTSESGFRAMYSKLWADEGNVRSWRNLIITYKGFIEDPDTHEKSESEKIYQATINANGTDDYEVKDNWLFKNLPWADAESASWAETSGLSRIEDYATVMVGKMQGVSWFPFEMWCAGLPYVETGDEVEINIGEYAYTSYVLRRTIKGIQNLQDEMINGTLDIF